jgi:FMN-dependent NADH-azoreductase
MKKLLHIISSPRGEESRTLQVSEVFLEGFKDNHPDWIIEELDLTKEDLPPLTLKRVDGKYVLLGGKDLFGELKEAWQEIIAHINRFMSADAYLISTPMWNFSIPYQLKHYIDIIVQPKFLFRYIANDAEGLVKNKKMVVITSRGRDYSTEETRSADLQEPYLRLIFGFVGITDITFIIAQPMDMGTVLQERGLNTAKEKARAMAKDF